MLDVGGGAGAHATWLAAADHASRRPREPWVTGVEGPGSIALELSPSDDDVVDAALVLSRRAERDPEAADLSSHLLGAGFRAAAPVATFGAVYIPVFNALDDADEIRALVAAAGTAELVTVGADGYPTSTLLPVLWEDDRLLFHLARANPQWSAIGHDAPALAVVTGPQAYVSPSWYAGKAEHGRVVPTWNYSAVHLTGRASVHTDEAWLRRAVSLLTDRHEQGRAAPWQVTDAPDDYVTKHLRGVVGVEMRVERVEAKAKLSQNRSADDHAGVVDGLAAEPGAQPAAVADAMRRTGRYR